ncbi:MAG: 2-C-methyl-D-erythritol 2,4-cyclodiphosphate synthase [Firmicutes bacterium]|nr:2-C-methyl-D-erythritol 2,4-cyclodiphosphate synthase [Bacillota bacterium]MDD4263736.1 2-C-methyl-D-erythritol 2,4-cyclodiphosphate synthase [Bacillota bacterium]MDD4693089.1 2-C-methyl-D-erythritol 2,4-cyclodiphosphate synthase [Bacillota bacterium]
METAAIILAAGKGSRLGLGTNKVLLPFRGKPLLYYSVKAFAELKQFTTLVLVVREGEEEKVEELVREFMNEKKIILCHGGKTRGESVFSGLKALSKYNPQKVLIHDGARPFVSEEVILRVLDNIKPNLAVTPGVMVSDSLRKIDKNGSIIEVIDRSLVCAVQTPQGFMYDELYRKHQNINEGQQFAEVTDDAQLFDKQVLVEGDSKNIKITTRGDYDMYNVTETGIRVGQGFDVHSMVSGRELIIGGVKIPSTKGLLGHSDADVLVHAIIDAILGACSLGDIGEHFPDTDNIYKNISSLDLLKIVKVLIDQQGKRVVNVDATILAQAPKLSPFKAEMEENIASILNVSKQQVNIKATTTEKLGFVGRSEGIAAMAIVAVS